MSKEALEAQLKQMNNQEKHIALSALIDVVCDYPFGTTVTEQNLASLFTETQFQYKSALEKQRKNV